MTAGVEAATGASSAPRNAAWADQAVELYIYYRVEEISAAAAWAVVRDFQQRLCAAHPGLQARLLRRPEIVEEQQTWMETYRFEAAAHGRPPRGVDAALQAAIEAAALPLSRFVRGPRHPERFIPCA